MQDQLSDVRGVGAAHEMDLHSVVRQKHANGYLGRVSKQYRSEPAEIDIKSVSQKRPHRICRQKPLADLPENAFGDRS